MVVQKHRYMGGSDIREGIQVNLTEKEKVLIEEICKGLTEVEIANRLSISRIEVSANITNLLEKTKTRNTAHLVMFAAYYKIISL